MSIVRVVNNLGTHIFVNSLNKNIPPKGSISISRSQFESDPDLAAIEGMGYVRLEQAESDPEEGAPAPAAESESDLEGERQESADFGEKEPPYRTSEFVDDSPKSASQGSTVATPDGPVPSQPIDMGAPAHLKDRLGNREAALPDGRAMADGESLDEPEKQYVDGIEVVDTTSDEPESETIDGIEIIDTNKADHDELGDQFIEKIDSENTNTETFPPNNPRQNF